MKRLILALLFCVCAPVHAAWQYQSAGTVASDTDARSGSGGITVSHPSGLAAGDNVVLYCSFKHGVTPTWDTPSGWTLLKTQGTAGNGETSAWARTADASMVSAGSTVVTASAAGNNRCFMLRFTGGPASDYSTGVASAGQPNNSAVQDIATPALTIPSNNMLVLFLAMDNVNQAASGVNSYPASATGVIASASSFGTNEFSVYAGYLIQTTGSNISSGSIDLVSTGTGTSISTVVAIPVGVVAPSFTSGPTKTADGVAGNTFSATPNLGGDANVTWHMGVYKAGQGCPSAANVAAGSGTGFVAHFSKVITGADTQSSTGLDYPKGDYCQIVSNSAGNSSVNQQQNIAKSPPAGYIYDVLASVSSTSWCNGISSPAAAASDVVELTSPTAVLSQTVTVDGTCDWTFNNTGARDRICARVYDYSAQDWMSITSPSASCSGTRAAIWFNNQAPTAPEPGSTAFFVPLNSAMTPVDLTTYCPDPEGDTVTVTGTGLPTGLSISSSTLQGTATSRGIYTDPVFTCTDIANDSANW